MSFSPFHLSPAGMLKSACLLFPFVLELLVLHAFVRFWLGPDNTTFGMYGRDVLIPLLLGTFLYLCYLQRETGLSPKFRWKASAVNLGLFITTLFFLVGLTAGRIRLSAELAITALFLLVLGTVLSSWFVFADPSQFLAHFRSLGRRLWYGVAGLGLLLLYPQMLTLGWQPMAQLTGKSVGGILALFGFPVDISVGRGIDIHHPKMAASIGVACSGLEGIFFFLFFLFLLRTFEKKSPGKRFELTCLMVGTVFLFFLNVVRIAGFFLLGLFLSSYQQRSVAHGVFRWAFHSNIGWLFYGAGLVLFFQIRHWLMEKQGMSPALPNLFSRSIGGLHDTESDP